ncbi:MAG TPA: SCO family protein [Caulobacteraceae bacterium]
MAIAALAILGAGVAVMWRNYPAAAPPASAIGGPFTLTDQNGRRVDARILAGKWSAVYFGYTFCPDVCPTTLARLGQAQQQLGPRARDFQVIFITVDPGRDTPGALRAYLANPAFPKGMIGLTGSVEEIKAAAAAYRVYYARRGAGPDYSVDHTSIIYLMDPKGRFVKPIAEDAPTGLAGQIAAAMDGR